MASFASSISLTTSLSARNFFPKFENLKSQEPFLLSVLTPSDILLVTKKHSGSLILIHGVYITDESSGKGAWNLVANSKNGTNNEFSIAAEHYFRAQFAAVFGSEAECKLLEFASFLGVNSFTFCFEFVTSFLGDHGQRPHVPYAVLTCISQFNETTFETRFASLPEMVNLACIYKLILNEMWVVSAEAAVAVSDDLHTMRWTGEDRDFTTFLDSRAVYKIHSMLPHAVGQGQLLEGLVVQVCHTSADILGELQVQSASMMVHTDRLLAALHVYGDAMSSSAASFISFCPPSQSSSVKDVMEFFNKYSTDSSPIGKLFNELRLLDAKIRFVSLKCVDRGDNKSVIIHVHQDDIFFNYARNKPKGASHLYRGMEIFLQRAVPNEIASSILYNPPLYQWDIKGISKWKNWQYLKRTFCMRNPLSTLFRAGHDAYMTNVLRQFVNWGLPRQLYETNRELMSTYGRWMLAEDGCKTEFLASMNKFGYLSYVEKFLLLYESGALRTLLIDEDERKGTVVFVLCFRDRPTWLDQILQGYTVKYNHKAALNNPYTPGSAFFLNGKLPKFDFCKCPSVIIVVPPTGDYLDRKAASMYEEFLFAASELRPTPHMIEIQSEEQVAEVQEHLVAFETAHQPKRVFLLAFAGLPPGSGKSTIANAFIDAVQSSNVIQAAVVSSDHYGMIHGPKSKAARAAFETAVISALTSGVDVVVFDKNIPDMRGYESMKSIAVRAALPKLVVVPVVPKSLLEEDLDIFVQRVLNRPHGTHTLTAESVIKGFKKVEDFVLDVFGRPCIDFVPVAQLLPGAVILDNMLVPGAEVENARFLLDQLINWDTHRSHIDSMNLTVGDYLGLCFELDLQNKELIQETIGMPVRKLLHATIVYYRGNSARLAEAACLLKTVDVKAPVTLRMTRLGLVRGRDFFLGWASLYIPGFEGEPMHATLIADRVPAFFARLGEIAYDEGILTIKEQSYVIEKYELPPGMEFEAWWSVC